LLVGRLTGFNNFSLWDLINLIIFFRLINSSSS